MGKNKNFNKSNNKNKEKIIDVNYKEVENKSVKPYKQGEEIKEPTFENGNYIICVTTGGEIIKKIAVAGSEIYITKLTEGGMAIDLK